jgi:hypothetical protein
VVMGADRRAEPGMGSASSLMYRAAAAARQTHQVQEDGAGHVATCAHAKALRSGLGEAAETATGTARRELARRQANTCGSPPVASLKYTLILSSCRSLSPAYCSRPAARSAGTQGRIGCLPESTPRQKQMGAQWPSWGAVRRALTVPVGSTPCSSQITCTQAGRRLARLRGVALSKAASRQQPGAPPRTWRRSGCCREARRGVVSRGSA